jgi:hypothetical protein
MSKLECSALLKGFDRQMTIVMSDTWAQCYKPFFVRNLLIFVIS